MTDLPLPQRERTVVEELIRLSAERARAEARLEEAARSGKEAAEKLVREARQRVFDGLESEKAAADKDFQEARRNVVDRFEAENGALEKEYKETRRHLETQHDLDREAAEKETQEAVWAVSTVFESSKNQIEEQHKELLKQTAETLARTKQIQQSADEQLEEWNQDADEDKGSPRAGTGAEPSLSRLKEILADAEACLTELKELRVPRLFKGERLLWLTVAGWLGVMIVLAAVLRLLAVFQRVPLYASGWPRGWYWWFFAGTFVCTVGGVLLRFRLAAVARAQVAECYQPLRRTLAEARALAKRCQDESVASFPRLLADNKQRHERDRRRVDVKFYKQWEEMKTRYESTLRQLDEKYPALMQALKERSELELRQVNEKYARQPADIKKRYELEAQEVQKKYQQLSAENQQRRQQDWTALVENWRKGSTRVQALAARIVQESARWFPGWPALAGENWAAPDSVPAGIRFGELHIGPEHVPDGVPADERLRPLGPGALTLPALLPFPERASLLLDTGDTGREPAAKLLQAVMLRFLTALPPGKVRFTIVDPVGLGENFATFMHLADYEEALVTSRIWTEAQPIDQRLADLTEHMENVIQKYLRNQFRSIAEYNAQAGEVAEPYRVLVIANFPVNFSESAARRLASIAGSGAGCGVFTLVSVDRKQPLPQGFQMRDLEQAGVHLIWKDQRFVWKDSDFGKFPLKVDDPPPAEQILHVLQRLGEKAKSAGRVEVPFEVIAPAPERWWTSDSRRGIDVPLGRAGAVKLQHLQLGQGTSQHVLIAGKTGSGKSTLLHALITNLALSYSPDEVELYLIDFKKGVEFKTYATHALPHARVVAIESEREFGLSVLQRLDAELKERGDRFRGTGVQDLAGYRQTRPDAVLPRVLLIVDEFQEFFIEDDKIAQDTSLLLDRLVRQGRAFGIHVLLGSQTLGGAYSLARSTLGQMAVRIALQCSEADAHCILSEDNSAARLLSRPGEAIYNDANGVVEGNDFFQVVWLPDARREEYLRHVHALAQKRNWSPPHPLIVFEGNVPADPGKNPWLARFLNGARQPTAGRIETPSSKMPQALSAWLGEAIAIKDPTAAVFRPQSGSNLLIIGQREEEARALLTAALVGLGAQGNAGPEPARFYLLDSTPADDPRAELLARLAARLALTAQVANYRNLPALLAELAGEVERRLKEEQTEFPPRFLFIHGIQRFRDLRKAEDDFGFGREDKPASPSQQLATILREGPAVAVHALVWCASLNDVNRVFDRQALREFEMRVLFQMSAADSSALIDSPAASRLGLHRALFYTEERGQPEKFRPYGLPAGT